jgi:ribonuclease E
MSKEIYISSTPHETRLAIVEKDELSEIYYERENEYTLSGSIYNGKVTRVLPGMQSAFVDIGLERDAFLYITDFMEEAADTAEFEGADASGSRSRTSNGAGRDRDRGARGRSDRPRGDRSRSDEPRAESPRPERQQETPSEVDSLDALDASAQPSEADADGASGDPSRRWRGRRGRRRGRSRTDQPGTETNGAATEPQPEVEAIEFGPGPSDPGEDLAVPEAHDSRPHRDGRDRRPRGRDDRGPRADRPRRDDRAERPRREEASDSGPSPEPIILPGESLSRYRRNDEAQQADASSASSQPVVAPRARPSSEVNLETAAWDGGFVLPGETLSRRNRPEASSSQPARTERPARESRNTGSENGRDRRRERDARRGPNRPARAIDPSEAVQPAVTSQHEPEPTFLPLSDDTPNYMLHATEERLEIAEHVAADPVIEPETDLAPAAENLEAAHAAEEVHEQVLELEETTHEYEPAENASASFRVDPAGTREFRQGSAGDEHVELEAAAETTSQPDHEFTTLQDTGDLISELPETDATAAGIEHPTAPIEHERAVQSVHLNEAEAATPSGDPHQFAPGDGQLEEEVIDDEDGDLAPASAMAGEDDTEEETLENAADLGSMLREMSIDQITRPQDPALEDEEDDEEEDDEFDIDEEEMENDEAFEGAHAADGDEAAFSGSDVSEAEEDEYAASSNFDGLDEESGEGTEQVSADSESAPRREGQRDSERSGDQQGRRLRRGSRDRDRDRGRAPRTGGGNGGEHQGGGGGRRRSVQAMDLPAISDLLKPGQEVLVQIAKEPIAKKGARITSHIALPGRFLVFMPTVNHIGVSRKIESDGERRRLKEVLLSEKGDASGGFIVRTAASGASEDELRSDLRFLLNLWKDIKARSEGSKSPALIYHDLNLVERILRDQVTDNFSAIWVDTEAEYERVLRFLQRFQPALIRRVKLYSKDTPLFEQFGIAEEINKALRSKVWLKSGGSIVINQTEALVAIDINTGKYVGKTARLEDTIVKTNLDAIPEIVRQMRLRDLGGIIIIDFIDMDERKNRNKVMAALEEELKNDRAPSKVLQFNDFGLVAITRKRVKQSLERTLSTTCSICTGTGMTKAPITVCNEIYIELRKMHRHLDKGDIMLRVHPEVVKQLKSNGGKWLQDMEELSRKTILVKSDPSLHPEQFDIH